MIYSELYTTEDSSKVISGYYLTGIELDES